MGVGGEKKNFEYLQKKKTVKLVRQPNNLDRAITFNCVTLKNTQTEPKK